jgi:septum formation inhibitor-activating ATPase MinD
MSYKVLLTSLKGGTGVTTCAFLLSKAISARGERVLLFDGDGECSPVLHLAGLDGENVYSLGDAERGACRVKQALLQVKSNENFFILPSDGLKDTAFADTAIKEIDGLFDYIICDDVARHACDRALVVTEPYPLSIKCADRQIGKLRDGGFKDVGLILNKVNGGLVFDGATMTPQEIATILKTPLVAVIPEDLNLAIGKHKKATAQAFKLAADILSGKGDKMYNVIKDYVGPLGYFRRRMRERI